MTWHCSLSYDYILGFNPFTRSLAAFLRSADNRLGLRQPTEDSGIAQVLSLAVSPMKKGFRCLCAVMDWSARQVPAWRVCNSRAANFGMEALTEALEKYGSPEIFNADQGRRLTSLAFTEALEAYGARISIDGRRRWGDNVFRERLWRSLKDEEISRNTRAASR